MELDLSKVQEIYDKARFLLVEFGKKDGYSTVFVSERIQIRGSTESVMLSVYFDNREHTGEDYPSNPISVDSRGQLRSYSEPHLSEKEVGEDECRDDVYLPWTNWLERAYREGNRRKESLLAADTSNEEE
jgi:hypothetical protein